MTQCKQRAGGLGGGAAAGSGADLAEPLRCPITLWTWPTQKPKIRVCSAVRQAGQAAGGIKTGARPRSRFAERCRAQKAMRALSACKTKPASGARICRHAIRTLVSAHVSHFSMVFGSLKLSLLCCTLATHACCVFSLSKARQSKGSPGKRMSARSKGWCVRSSAAIQSSWITTTMVEPSLSMTRAGGLAAVKKRT